MSHIVKEKKEIQDAFEYVSRIMLYKDRLAKRYANKNVMNDQTLGFTQEELKYMGYDPIGAILPCNNIREFYKLPCATAVAQTKNKAQEFKGFFSKMKRNNLLPEWCSYDIAAENHEDMLSFVKRDFLRASFMGEFGIHSRYYHVYNQMDVFEKAGLGYYVLNVKTRNWYSQEDNVFLENVLIGMPSLFFRYLSESVVFVSMKSAINKLLASRRDIEMKAEMIMVAKVGFFDIAYEEAHVVIDEDYQDIRNINMENDETIIPYSQDVEILTSDVYCTDDQIMIRMMLYDDALRDFSDIGFDVIDSSLLPDEMIDHVLSFLTRLDLIRFMRVNKGFYAKCRRHIKFKTYAKSRYESLIAGETQYGGIDSCVPYLTSNTYSFVVKAYVMGLGIMPGWGSSFFLNNQHSFDPLYIFIMFSRYRGVDMGTELYYFFFREFCEMLRDKWKMLKYILRTVTDMQRFFSFRQVTCEHKANVRASVCLSSNIKLRILEDYGMEELHNDVMTMIPMREIMRYVDARDHGYGCLMCISRRRRDSAILSKARLKFDFEGLYNRQYNKK